MNNQSSISLVNREQRARILADLENVTDIPTLPTVFLNVMSLVRNPNTTMKEVAAAVETDPAISMKILKLINSAFYGLARTVDSVHQAVVLLGTNTLKNIVMSVSIFKALSDTSVESSFDRVALWQHSIGCGLIARVIEKHQQIDRNEEGFIAGVIHDIGKIVLDRYFPKDLVAVRKAIQGKNISFYQAEKEELGVTHCEIGAILAEKWHLPENLVEIISYHHEINPDSEHARFASLIHISNILARKYGVGSGGDNHIPEFDPTAMEQLDLSLDQLEAWNEEILAEIDMSQELFEALVK